MKFSLRIRLHLLVFVVLLTIAVDDIRAQSSPRMKAIPAGSYIRGRHKSIEKNFSYDHAYDRWEELQTHPVRITKPFYISASEVTVEQFRQFVEATGYVTTAEQGDTAAVGFRFEESERPIEFDPFRSDAGFNWKHPGFEQTDDHPVVCVSWKDAQAYCEWLSRSGGRKFRLPTEAEWEYACRAGEQEAFWWGNAYRGTIHERANIANAELEKAHVNLGLRHWLFNLASDPGDEYVYTAPVRSFPPNRWGLYDTHGNVWEWCQDTYVETSYRELRSKDARVAHPLAVDPVCNDSWNEFGDWRVIRGGSWYSSPANSRSDLRCYYDAPHSACYLGFRVAHDGTDEQRQAAAEEWQLEQQATERVLDVVKTFTRSGPGGAERGVEFRETATADIARDLHRISNLTTIVANCVEANVIEHFVKVPGLKKLQIHNADGVTDDDVVAIENAETLEKLEFLWGQSQLTDASIPYINKLQNLDRLKLNAPAMTDAGLSRLTEIKQLRSLDLSVTGTKGGVLESLGKTPLKGLGLGDLSDENATRLADLDRLTSLTCNGPGLTGVGFVHVGNLKLLTQLNLQGSRGISPEDFGPLRLLTQLTHLNLSDTRAGDNAMRCLIAMNELHSLVTSQEITDTGLIHICNAVSLNSITIPSAKITDAGFQDMWKMQKLNTLRLDAQDAKITGDGFAAMTEAQALQSITIRSTAFTDVGMKYLSMMPRLQYIVIGNRDEGPTQLTNNGLLMLTELEHLQSLTIGTKNSQITEEGIAKLKSAMPNVQFDIRI